MQRVICERRHIHIRIIAVVVPGNVDMKSVRMHRIGKRSPINAGIDVSQANLYGSVC